MAVRTPLEDKLFMMYRDLWDRGNEVCPRCRALPESENLSLPLSIWHVGQEFAEDRHRLMFVGKAARGPIDGQSAGRFEDGTACAKSMFMGTPPNTWARKAAYWAYTRRICEKVYGSEEAGWDRIAFSNIIKCNSSENTDTTTPDRVCACMRELGVIWKEIDVIRPRKIIFYTHGWPYDDFLVEDGKRHLWGLASRGVGSRAKATRGRRKCGQERTVSWWDDTFEHVHDKTTIRFLRTSHPQLKNQESFVNLLKEWINNLSDHPPVDDPEPLGAR